MKSVNKWRAAHYRITKSMDEPHFYRNSSIVPNTLFKYVVSFSSTATGGSHQEGPSPAPAAPRRRPRPRRPRPGRRAALPRAATRCVS